MYVKESQKGENKKKSWRSPNHRATIETAGAHDSGCGSTPACSPGRAAGGSGAIRQSTLPLTESPPSIVFSSPVNESNSFEPKISPVFPAVQPRRRERSESISKHQTRGGSSNKPEKSYSYLSATGHDDDDGHDDWWKHAGGSARSSRRSLDPTEGGGVEGGGLKRSRMHFGSAYHIGSSVTFCNQPSAAGDLGGSLHPLNHDDGVLRRSCSITLVYPTENLLSGGGASNGKMGVNGMVDDSRSLSTRNKSNARNEYDFPSELLLSPPSITFNRVSTAPNMPSWGGRRSEGGCMGGSIRSGFGFGGSSYQLQARSKAVMVTPRGSFLAINQSPMEFRESTLSINYPNCGDDDGVGDDEVSLVYTRLEKIPMKDFAAEIRAHLDVEQFLSQAQLMLDVQETDMELILNKMLHHLLDKEEAGTAFQDAMKALFTDSSVHQLSKTLQCTCCTYGGGFDYDQSWKGTKNALETGRTFATLFADMDLRLRLLGARSENEFKQFMWEHMKELAEEQYDENSKRKFSVDSECKVDEATANTYSNGCWFARGLRADAKRRLPYYASDFKDGFCGPNTLHKTISTTFFLYFACILPAIALGVLNYNNTGGKIDVRKAIYSQTIGGLVFAAFGGQPMVIMLTTAPLALYTKVIYNICEDWQIKFEGMYACTGLWNSLFLLIYAFTDASKLMKWCTRSTEEIFALFISMAFAVDAFKDAVYDFKVNYNSPACDAIAGLHENTTRSDESSTKGVDPPDEISSMALKSVTVTTDSSTECLRENSLLYLLLMVGTVWLGLSLYNFTKTPFLNASKRELLADCALPVSVILMSFFGSYVFRDVKLTKFDVIPGNVFKPAPLSALGLPEIFGAMGLGFCLSILFFMDQNIAGAMVNSPDNRMKKGSAYHWDLMIVALVNAVLAYFGLPMVHGALPHSPLHVRAMADKEDRVYQGHVYLKIVSVRETRVTGILSHILIGLSVQFIDKLRLIPRPVLDGLFLYLAITALHSNQLFERIMLLVTEQAAYPPNHYIRTVPQRKVHLFTFLQLLQLAMLCGFGFAPVSYLKMVFPVLHLVMLPIRHKLVPRLVEKKYLHSLDGH